MAGGRFVKGVGGNPKGRKPDEFSFWAMVKRASVQEDHKTIRAAAEKFLKSCAKGESWAVKELFERADGRVAQKTVHSGDAENPVTFTEIRRTIIRDAVKKPDTDDPK